MVLPGSDVRRDWRVVLREVRCQETRRYVVLTHPSRLCQVTGGVDELVEGTRGRSEREEKSRMAASLLET